MIINGNENVGFMKRAIADGLMVFSGPGIILNIKHNCGVLEYNKRSSSLSGMRV